MDHAAYLMPAPTPPAVTGTVSQTFEILFDSGFNANSYRGPDVSVIHRLDRRPAPLHPGHQRRVRPGDGTNSTIGTNLYNPTPSLPNFSAGFATHLPGQYLAAVAQTKDNLTLGTAYPFQLDGRWLHAFNGPGIGATTSAITGFSNAIYGNFRYNGLLNRPAQWASPTSRPTPSAWTKTTTPATWKTGSWRSRAPTAR